MAIERGVRFGASGGGGGGGVGEGGGDDWKKYGNGEKKVAFGVKDGGGGGGYRRGTESIPGLTDIGARVKPERANVPGVADRGEPRPVLPSNPAPRRAGR